MAQRRFKLINSGLSANELAEANALYAPISHTHTESDITDLGNYSVVGHTHVEADITDLNFNVRPRVNFSGSRTLLDSDVTKHLELSTNSAVTLTIPADTGLTSWEDGAYIDIVRTGTSGILTLSPATGVRIRGREGGVSFDVTATTHATTNTYRGQGFRLSKRGTSTDQWYFQELTV